MNRYLIESGWCNQFIGIKIHIFYRIALLSPLISAWDVVMREPSSRFFSRVATGKQDGAFAGFGDQIQEGAALRRESREYAREQARKHREILALVEAELNLPKSLRRYAKKAQEEE